MAKVPQLHDNLDRTKYYVLRRENILGRAPDATIVFGNNRVSRHHAKIACAPGTTSYYVEDLSGRGTYVNFRKVKGRFPLQEGDRISILVFRNIHPIELEKMTDRDLKECCGDARNDSVKAIVDLTFQYAEVEEPKPVAAPPEPEGFLEKVKAFFRRK
jgi:hypothetical protein